MMEGISKRAQQLQVLLKKDFKLALRSWKTTCLQIFAPVVFLGVLLAIQEIPHSAYYSDSNPPAVEIPNIPRCTSFDYPYCFSLMYAPSNLSSIDPIIQHIANKSGLPIVPFNEDPTKMTNGAIVACESEDQIIDFLWDNQNVTQGAVIFDYHTNFMTSGVLSYNIYFNGTCLTPYVPVGTKCPNIRYAIQRSVDEAFAANLTNSETTLKVSRRPFPIVSYNTALNDTVSSYGILFFYCGMMFCFVIIIYQLVFEKERKLKQGMKLMGLKSSVFWTSWFIHGTVLTFLEAFVTMLAGYLFMFGFFWETNFMVNMLIFFLFGEAMLTLAFWVSTMVKTSRQSITVGMLLFIIGVLLQMLLSSPELLTFLFYDQYWVSTMLYYILVFYPPFNFAKCIQDVTARSFDYGQYQGPGYSWSDLYIPSSTSGITMPPTVQSFYLLMLNTIIFAILTWYFENVLPSEGGVSRSPWFFITDEYWGISRRQKTTSASGSMIEIQSNDPLIRTNEDPSEIDDDVVKEDLQSKTPSSDLAVRIYRLSKIYKRFPFIRTKGDVHAQDKLSLCIPRGSLFCLLGHNGAGKTTTINILTGLFPQSSGDAWIYGRSVRYEMDTIRRSMGVCPQHDILWDELSAREHLDLFARLKGIPSSDRKRVIEEKLEMVRLVGVGNNHVRSYSGGMKRRLSVAISSIGEPNIIFMDEPTTGMDPMSRRHVWELIEQLKKDRVIVLTTHSMEEADVLADRIGVMAHGKLRCIGSGQHLKSKFGEGYRVTIAAGDHANEQVKQEVFKRVPSANLVAESGTSLVFGVPTDDHQQAIQLFKYLENTEKHSNSIVKDWGISQTSLEDVFLKVTREVYSGGKRLDLDPYDG